MAGLWRPDRSRLSLPASGSGSRRECLAGGPASRRACRISGFPVRSVGRDPSRDGHADPVGAPEDGLHVMPDHEDLSPAFQMPEPPGPLADALGVVAAVGPTGAKARGAQTGVIAGSRRRQRVGRPPGLVTQARPGQSGPGPEARTAEGGRQWPALPRRPASCSSVPCHSQIGRCADRGWPARAGAPLSVGRVQPDLIPVAARPARDQAHEGRPAGWVCARLTPQPDRGQVEGRQHAQGKLQLSEVRCRLCHEARPLPPAARSGRLP